MSGDVTACGGCGTPDLVSYFDMGTQPLAEGRSSHSHPLRLVRCFNCGLVQLSHVVGQTEVFPADHPYSTGNSALLRRHYQGLAAELARDLHVGDVVVDIGANDGTLLDSYPPGRGSLVKVAVEPTDQIFKCPPGIDRWHGFFTNDLACDMLGDPDIGVGPAKVITACNVLAHVPDPGDFLAGVRNLLDDDGVFVTENHDLASITEGLQFDTVYHEHLRYYTPGTLAFQLERAGLRVERIIPVPTHGGSFRTYARKVKGDFPASARRAATALRALLHQTAVMQNKKIYGIGAATRAVPLIHYAGIADYVSCVAEVPGSDKIGTKMPGTQIPVVDEQRLIADQPPYALLFAWHMADDILPKLRERGYKGRFIVPLPEPKVIDG